MPKIVYFSEELEFTLPYPRKTTQWIKTCIKNEGKELIALNFIFCTDSYLKVINMNYLKHNTYTDIITFDNSEITGRIEGDVFISIERVTENAQIFTKSFDEELHRVLIHGVLHLCGYRDKTAGDQKVMRSKENSYLSLRERST